MLWSDDRMPVSEIGQSLNQPALNSSSAAAANRVIQILISSDLPSHKLAKCGTSNIHMVALVRVMNEIIPCPPEK